MNEWLPAFAAVAGTVAVYQGTRWFYRRFPYPITLPIVTGTITIVLFLLVMDISYSTYMSGGQWIEKLLGPAVVALALPLYKQRETVKKYAFPLTAGITAGALAGVLSGYVPARWLGLDDELIATVLPKSVTTPVAMDIAQTTGGIPAVAAVFVMVAGIGGVVSASYVFAFTGISQSLAKGISFGAASHAIGTAKALENSELEGTAGSVAMTLSALLLSFITPLLTAIFF
ncbi:LrgB family protein [Salibacterium lacus]|uniref:LrgB family protein n=1 Tax=Salibacterium lacus TaxID=1898109 RepID=A0ABW5T1H2_9BACI